ncbi:hypothetical protein ACO2Q8_07930 [Larkinella sp. VNQ87]|uniref:hypothetical protein n=1 Tax=Larkinella sp. VNQ87 TaxID=3400921 RepID=UPI003C089D47
MKTATPKVSRKLTQNIVSYLSIKAQINRLTEQAQSLKTAIDAECDVLAQANQFDNGQLLVPTAGLVKVVMNPPKLIYAANNKPLLPVERAGLAKVLGDEFSVTDVNLTKIKNHVERLDALVLAALAGQGVKCVQEGRFDVKPLTD